MLEEHPVATAEVVEPRFALGRACDAVLWALSVAGEANLTSIAVGGKGALFVQPEGPLFGAKGKE